MQEKPRVFVVIPARLSSSRLPNKPLRTVCGSKTLLEYTAEQAAKAVRLTEPHVEFGGLWVVTEDDEIVDLCKRRNIDCMQVKGAWCGMARVSCFVDRYLKRNGNVRPSDVIIDWQVDEPHFTNVEALVKCAHLWPRAITTAYTPCAGLSLNNPNVVKVVVDPSYGHCCWFSRVPPVGMWVSSVCRHLGIYASTIIGAWDGSNFLPHRMSQTEKLEQLTWLLRGYKFYGVWEAWRKDLISVDTEDDLEELKRNLRN